MLANVIVARKVTVNRLYSFKARSAKIFETENKTQEIAVSLHGSSHNFLKLGTYPITSIAETINTETSGLSNCHQTTIADKAAIRITVSLLVIFFVPYFNEKRKTATTKNSPTVKLRAPQPPPPYQIPTTAVPVVIAQINQV